MDVLMRTLTEAVHQDGTTSLLGRTVHYDMDGYMHKWELHYKAEVVDVASGLRATANNYVARHTSLRHAFVNLLRQLAERGIIYSMHASALSSTNIIRIYLCAHESRIVARVYV